MENVLRYGEFREDIRLASGPGALEFARTQEILLRHLPPPPAVVLDLGGGVPYGPGWYSAWLADLG